MHTPKLIRFPSTGSSETGFISIFEKILHDFVIKRVYWTYKTPTKIERGNHAHRKLKQVLIAVSGKVSISLIDRQKNVHNFTLDSPEKGLYVPPMCWRQLKFSKNAVLLCLASDEYIESDYIRNIEDYYRFIANLS